MAGTIEVMIVDDSSEARESLRMLLDFIDGVEVVAEAENGAEALHKLSVLTPDVVMMDINMPVMDGVSATEQISLQYPNVAVIVLSVQNDVEYVRRCMRAGAKDYLFKPVTVDLLRSTIQDVVVQNRDRSQRTIVATLQDQTTQRSRVISFLSAKGGVGKTTIAVNTAVAFAQQGRKVALVDFDLQFGDVSLCMNIKPFRTVAELARESSEIDPAVVERYLVRHDSGVAVLTAPKRPEEAEYVTAAQVRVILQSLKHAYDYVFVDTTPTANDIFFGVLETSDECFMVNTLNLAVLKNNRLLLDVLQDLDYETSSIRHLLNRANAKNGLKVKDVNRVLKEDVYWELDNDFTFVETAANEGTPFVARDKNHRLSKQIYALTARIDEERGIRMSRRNPLKKLFTSRG